MSTVRCTLAFVLVLLTGGEAKADNADALWLEATEKMAVAQDREAVELLRTLVRDYPQSALSDDALFLAASLLEEKLGDPAAASLLYETLTKDYPESRSSLAAKRRLKSLNLSLGPAGDGAIPLAAFQDLLHHYPERGDLRSLALAAQLLKTHPKWAGAYRVRLWIADSRRRLGDYQAAKSKFEEVRQSSAPQSARFRASLGAADVEILRGDYSMALTMLDELAAAAKLEPSEAQAVRELRSRAHEGAARSTRVTASYLIFAAMLLALLGIARKRNKTWRSFWKELRLPPTEVLYMSPVALLFIAMALAGHREIGPAVSLICGGGILITWASANALRAPSRLGRGHALLCMSAATLATVSLCYVALHRSQLLDLLYTTIAFGPE